MADNGSIGEDRVDAVGHRCQHMLQKLPGGLPVGRVHELRDDELAGAVNGDEEIELSFPSLHSGNVDVKEADGIALEPLSFRLVAVHLRQARDAVALEAPMQCRARQMRDRGLKSVEAVIAGQQRMAPERHHHGLVRFS